MQIPETRITAPKSFSLNLAELRDNRELLYFFVWRDIKVKYRQAVLGILWAVLQPLLLMGMLYLVFFKALNQTTTVQYPLHAFGGLLFWGLFSSGITQSSESLINSGPMIRKIYFPRLIIPLSTLIAALLDFFFALIVFIILLIVFHQPVQWNIIWCFPLAIVFTFISTLGISLLLSALNVKYRDFRYLLPFAMQLIFFGSQIVYSIDSLITTPWIATLLYLNPLNGVLELFRFSFTENVNWQGIGISAAATLVLLSAGLFYFKRMETSFADII